MLFAAVALLTLVAGSRECPRAQARPAAGAAQAAQARGRQGDTPAPARKAGEGQGPFKKMVIRGVTLIDGTGGPPLSPMDIVIEGNMITDVRQGGWPGLPQQANREPRDFDFEIDGKGLYVMPGFVDMHVHGSTRGKAPDLSYAYDWLNRLTNMGDAVGTTKYTYSVSGLLTSEDGPFASDTW